MIESRTADAIPSRKSGLHMMRRRVVCQFKTLDSDKESSMKRGLCWLIIAPGVLVSCRSGREEGSPAGINPTTLMCYTHPVAMTPPQAE